MTKTDDKNLTVQLLARIDALESRPMCRCLHCCSDARRASDFARRDRHIAIRAMPDARARAAEMTAMIAGHREELLRLNADQLVAFVGGFTPDAIRTALASAPSGAADIAAIRLSKPVPYVRLTGRAGSFSRTQPTTLRPEQARNLGDAGLAHLVDLRGDSRDRHQYDGLHFGAADVHVFSMRQLAILRELDSDLAARIDRGAVVVEPLDAAACLVRTAEICASEFRRPKYDGSVRDRVDEPGEPARFDEPNQPTAMSYSVAPSSRP